LVERADIPPGERHCKSDLDSCAGELPRAAHRFVEASLSTDGVVYLPGSLDADLRIRAT
jgi:hypothetical protein